jgi:hypothetical protein
MGAAYIGCWPLDAQLSGRDSAGYPVSPGQDECAVTGAPGDGRLKFWLDVNAADGVVRCVRALHHGRVLGTRRDLC